MKGKPTITEILNYLLLDEKIRPSELARRTGVPQPTIHRMVTGTCPRPHMASIKPIAEYFGLTPGQLKGEELIPGLNMFKLDGLDGWAKIPLVAWKQLSTWPKQEYQYSVTEHGVATKKRDQTMTYTDANVKREAFAVYVNDKSMGPEFSEITLLIFDPEKAVENDSLMLIRLENGEVLFRQVLVKDGQRYYRSLNPDFDQTPQAINYNDEIIGVLIQTKRDY
jgi:transcriptional regulator with XRE-family HTH domain